MSEENVITTRAIASYVDNLTYITAGDTLSLSGDMSINGDCSVSLMINGKTLEQIIDERIEKRMLYVMDESI